MREWKQLFVNGKLFEKKKIYKNHLILTLADDYKTSQHTQNVLTNLKYLYNNSTPFNKAFALPYAQGYSIYLKLNRNQKALINFDTLVKIVQDSIPKKNHTLEPEQIESDSEQPQILKSEPRKRDRKAEQRSVNEAFEQGTLFQSVKISKMGVTFEIAEEFNSKEYYRFISQRLNTQYRTSTALAEVALPIKDLRRKPSLRLKANHQLTAEKLLNLFKTPKDTEKETLATIHTPEAATIPTVETPRTPPLLETAEAAEVTAPSPEITINSSPEATPDSDDAFEGLDEMLEQLANTSYRHSPSFDLDNLLASGTEGYLWDPDNSNQGNNVLFLYDNLSRRDLLSEEYDLPPSPEQQQNNLFLSMLKMRNV